MAGDGAQTCYLTEGEHALSLRINDAVLRRRMAR